MGLSFTMKKWIKKVLEGAKTKDLPPRFSKYTLRKSVIIMQSLCIKGFFCVYKIDLRHKITAKLEKHFVRFT